MGKDVIKPNHYKQNSLECYEDMCIIFGKKFVCVFFIMNSYKYIKRFRFKNGEEDLQKCKEYINMYKSLVQQYDLSEDLDIISLNSIVNEIEELCEKFMKEF